MWLHIVIFVILLLLTVCSTLGWIHVENIGTVKGRKMFLVVALAGNITGGLLTWTKGGGQVFEDGYELKKEENAYEEKFMVSVEGEETGSVYVQIPEKELEKEDTGQPEVLTKEEDEEQKLLEFVANYNSELEDSEYYYLPSDWEGRKLEWKIPYDTTGNMLAAIFLAAAFVMIVIIAREEQKARTKRYEELMMDYPGLIMKFTLLVQAGMTVRNTFRKMASDYKNKNEKRTPILRKPQISRYAIGKGHIRKLLRSLTLQPLTPYIPSAPRHNKLLYSLPTTQNIPAGPTTVSCGRQDTVEASQQG